MNKEKSFLRNAFKNTIENIHAKKEDYAKYFSADFIMHIDGKKYSFDEYVNLISNYRKETHSVNINFKEMIAENDTVATMHQTSIVFNDGKKMVLDVHAFFKIYNDQIVSGIELTKEAI